MENIEKNYNYFKKNKEVLIKKYPNQYIVISNEKVLFNSKNKEEAIEFLKKLTPGTYILQKCDVKEENGIQMFHTRVSF